MKHFLEKKPETVLSYGSHSTRTKSKDRLAVSEDFPANESRSLTSTCENACGDQSEEAIPERDPTYCLPMGTDYDGQTIEAVSPESRLDFVRRLQQFGMSHARAAVMASL